MRWYYSVRYIENEFDPTAIATLLPINFIFDIYKLSYEMSELYSEEDWDHCVPHGEKYKRHDIVAWYLDETLTYLNETLYILFAFVDKDFVIGFISHMNFCPKR